MSIMNEAMQLETSEPAGVAPMPPPAMSYNIKRSGGRPLRFTGSELLMAMSYSPAVPYWHEINMYRTTEQTFVTAVRKFYQSEHEQDTVRAWVSVSLDQAIEKLMRYDAGYDIPVDQELLSPTASPAELAAKAVLFQARIADARHHYKSLVGEFLYDLEMGQ